jgi:serine/threonine protein kinase
LDIFCRTLFGDEPGERTRVLLPSDRLGGFGRAAREFSHDLRAAHAAGLIHRDIKPSNIFVSRRGAMDDVAKLLDFGLVLAVARTGVPHLSGEGQILGMSLYISPEQATSSGELDGRSDIYSLGAVAYFLLTGRPPFEGEDTIRHMIAHARDPVVPPSSLDAIASRKCDHRSRRTSMRRGGLKHVRARSIFSSFACEIVSGGE